MFRWLKWIRVAVAVPFFLAVSFLFLDLGNLIPVSVHNFLTSLQFIPVLMRTLVSISFMSVGLLVIVTLTLLYGRVYCSTICPLGILQDIVIRIDKRINRRRWYKYRKPFYTVHYFILIISFVAAVSGSAILLNLLEPYSNYGRILSNLINPFVVSANNAIAYIFELFNMLSVARIPLLHVDIVSLLSAFFFFGLIIYLSYFYERLFCNLLCPAGALLGIISRFSLYKIVIDENSCTECGLCEMVCKANCIESNLKKIDFSACVGCFNCLAKCKPKGMSYKRRRKPLINVATEVDESRRTVLKSAVIPLYGLLLPKMEKDNTLQVIHNDFYESHRHPISPPGSISIEHFTTFCTACHLCVSSCPTQVLYPSSIDYGFAGIFQPKMNYTASYCNYDCVMCSQICPSGAILPLDSDAKKKVQIGRAYYERNDCVVITKGTDCGACSEHCPTKAVYMVPYGLLSIPEVNDDICVGCGACEHACPAEPRKAIFVQSNYVHQKAKKPESKKAEPSFDSSQDFPF